MHTAIGAAVSIDLDDENLLVCNDKPRDPTKSNNGEYYGFDKDLDVDEAVDCTNTEIEADIYHQSIGAELQLHDKDGMKQTAGVCQIFCDAYGNPEDNGNYRAWEDYNEYKIEFLMDQLPN